MTREITMIVVHCSATRCNHPYTVHQLYHDHVEVNHWRYIGYHFFISRDGKVHATRPLERMGAHARGWMHIPSESAMRADWMRTAMWQIPVPGSRRRRWRNWSFSWRYSFPASAPFWDIVICLGCRRRVPVLMPPRCSPCYIWIVNIKFCNQMKHPIRFFCIFAEE